MTESIIDIFKGEDIQIQYTVLGYRIDLYFYEYKLAIEINELGHNDRNTDYEIKRQREIEEELNLVRTNPDAADFNMNRLKSQIYKHIIKSKKEKLNSKFAKELLCYASSIFLLLKPIKYFVKKNTSHIVKNEKHTIKNKVNKTWKTTWNKIVFKEQKIILKILYQKK